MLSWWAIRDDLARLVHAGPLGITALASFGASALAALVLVGSAIRARRSLGSLWFGRIAALVVGAFLVGVTASALIVKGAHAMILNPPPPEGASAFLGDIARLHAAWSVFGIALSLVATLSFVAALVRGGKNAPLTSIVALLCASTGVGLLHAEGVRTSSGCYDPSVVHAALAELSADSIAATNLLRLALVAAAVIGSVIVVWFDRKNPTDTSEAEEENMLGRGAAVFAFGLAAFFATRGMAHDARHPIPLRTGNEAVCPTWVGARQEVRMLPPAGACDMPCDSIVDVGRNGAWIDGIEVSNPGALEVVLNRKRELYDLLRGDRPPMPLVVTIAAADDMPLRDVVPWISAAMRVGRAAIAIAGVHPAKRLSTATVGELDLTRCCCSSLRIDPSAPPLGSRATWGEVARASQRGEPFSITFEGR